jgi:hypothetical protein
MTAPRSGISATPLRQLAAGLTALVPFAATLNCTPARADEIPSYLTPAQPAGIGNSCGENAMESSISEVLGRATLLLGEERVKAGLAMPLNIETRLGMIHAYTIGQARKEVPESGEAKALADLAERLHAVQTTLAMEDSYCEAQRAAEYERTHPAGVVYSAVAEEQKKAAATGAAALMATLGTTQVQEGSPQVTITLPNGRGTVVAMTGDFWNLGTSREGR